METRIRQRRRPPPSTGAVAANVRITEAGTVRITEAGDQRRTE